MKKRMHSRIFVMLLALCTVLMMFSIAAAAADDEDGCLDEAAVKVILNGKADGCGLRLCEVGKYTNGAYVLYEQYAECGADMTNLSESSAAQEAAEKLAAVASLSEGGMTNVVSDGTAYFFVSSGESKVYVLIQTSGTEKAKISPSLIVMPYVDENSELVEKIDLYPKWEPITKEVKGSVILNKYDVGGKVLEGAVFELQRMTEYEEGQYDLPYVTVLTGLVTDKNGQIVINDLPAGNYRFVETQAPNGYKINPDLAVFHIRESGTVKISGGIYVAGDDNTVLYDVIDEPAIIIEESSRTEISVDAPSNPESSLPKPDDPPVITGEDIAKFTIIGIVFGVTLVAIVLLIVLGKKKKYDDDDDN